MISWTLIALAFSSTADESSEDATPEDDDCSTERLYNECFDKCNKEGKKCSDECSNTTWGRVFCNSICSLDELTCGGRCGFRTYCSRHLSIAGRSS